MYKEAVALWNITKHENNLHLSNLMEWCHMDEERESELDLHHDFSPTATRISNERVRVLTNYINMIKRPFNCGCKLHNVCSDDIIPQNVIDGILKCLEVGESSYEVFKKYRLLEKSVKLHDTIDSNKKIVLLKPLATNPTAILHPKAVKLEKDVADALRYIDYARERNYDFSNLLKFEITSTSYFLIREDKKHGGLQIKKSDKSAISR